MIQLQQRVRGFLFSSFHWDFMMSKHVLAVGLLSCLAFSAQSGWVCAHDQIPGAPQKQPIAIVGATIHTIAGRDIENGTIIFVGGKITAVGKGVEIPADAEVIRAEGKHVYPSLIDANSDIGLVEVNSIRATIDSRETGNINPNVRAVAAFNPDSELIPVNRANGVLVALSAPTGGLIAGRSAVMVLDGWTWEDMTLKADAGMHIRWPRDAGRELQELDELLEQTARYVASRKVNTLLPLDLRLESMARVLDGSLLMVADATSITQIESAVAFAKQRNLKLVIHGGYEAEHCAELLKKADVPVIVSGVYRTPSGRDNPYDEAYTLPKRLKDAGIKFCICSGGRFGASGVRNLPYHAATASAYGLSQEDALKSITLNAAQILGVADRVGALATDLDATLFIADGNILETETQVLQAFVQGRKVDLDNRHQQLYRKYSAKYDQLLGKAKNP
ncbi:MAG: amidohydrolase family protein [Pirellulaceae bacterium]|nr:amidohydrolase family protein [Pirellulaceae bacterium]